MKHSIAVKFTAILLCALSVVAIAASGFGILFMEAYNLYNEPLETQKQEQLDYMAQDIAWYYAQRHAAESLGNCPIEVLDEILPGTYLRGSYAVLITENGDTVCSVNRQEDIPDALLFTYSIAPNYPIVSYQYTIDEYGTYATEVPGADEPAAASETGEISAKSDAAEEALARVENETPVFTSEYSDEYWDDNGVRYHVGYTLNYYQGPQYEVSVYLAEQSALGTDFALMSLLYPYRDLFIPTLLASLLVFAVTLVYLCVAAGRTKSGEIVPAGLNRLPLDLYFLLAGSAICGLAALMFLMIDSFYGGYYSIWDNLPLCIMILGLGGFAIALLAIGFLFALAAQAKVRGGYWWRHSVCGWCLRQLVTFLRWVRRGLRYFYRGCRAVVRLLPVIWQWLAVVFGAIFVMAMTLLLSLEINDDIALLLIPEGFVCIGLVIYAAWCFGVLLKGVKHMAQGNLNYQIDTKYLFGCFKEFAEQLNSVAGAAQIAAERQMKSERMKTELITNVSHDIKTPLTSIINYVDLLQKAKDEAERAQYLEVLDRQSQRLKKLIEDLMEMSRASSGNVAVEITPTDVCEAVSQALGEFADTLDACGLTVLYKAPAEPVLAMSDGKHLWRVLSNCLSNVVKYALPGTRVYVDVARRGQKVEVSVKNISAQMLNISADELMERFVRGDSSRNTEGNGLGLNIAKSLMELQGGRLDLIVDGDLFKVVLTLNAA